MSRSRKVLPSSNSEVSTGPSSPAWSTPIFSNGTLGKHAAYVQELSEKYRALANIVREEAPSPPRSPVSPFALAKREGRVSALRGLVREAWVNADGNPADGKWAFLSQLLQMGVTSGRHGRWVGVRTDVKSPEQLDGSLRWPNVETEAEWREWERRYSQEKRVKDKVENWKRKVDVQQEVVVESIIPFNTSGSAPIPIDMPAPNSKPLDATTAAKVASDTNLSKPGPSEVRVTVKSTKMVKSSAAKSTSVLAADPLRDAAPFGFGVVKRSSQQSVVGKPNAAKSNSPKDVPSSSFVNGGAASKPQPAKDIRDISDTPDLSFLAPSFRESQLHTSTPKPAAKPQARATTSKTSTKPTQTLALPTPSSSPLPALTSSIPPSASPANAKPTSKDSNRMRLPPIPSSPKRATKPYSRTNPNESPSGHSLETSASLPAIPLPTTPTRRTIAATMSPSRHTPLFKSNDGHPAPGSSLNEESTTGAKFNSNNKRPLESPRTPGQGDDGKKLKKARTLPQANSPWFLAARSKVNDPPISQPPSPQTPRRSKTRVTPAGPSSPTTPKRIITDGLPTLMELLASTKKLKKPSSSKTNKTLEKGKEKAKLDSIFDQDVEDDIQNLGTNPYIFDPFSVGVNRNQEAHQDLNNDLNPSLSLDVNENIDDMVLDLNPVYGFDEEDRLELELASPTKSLSSIADSDEEEEEDELDELDEGGGMCEGAGGMPLDFSFRPLATSTQVQPQFERGRGPFVSKSNFVATSQRDGNAESQWSGSADSWASVYATGRPTTTTTSSASGQRPAPLAIGSSNPFLPSGASGTSSKMSKSSQRPPQSSSLPYAYNSQFQSTVAAQVDRVDKLLEKDVDCEVWLKDPDVEEKESEDDDDGFGFSALSGGYAPAGTGYSASDSMGGGVGQNGLSYGYGKAFEYDASP